MMRRGWGWRLAKEPVYRSFRRRILLATAALFLLGLLAALLVRHGGSLWTVVLWTAVCSPVVVTLAIAVMLPLSRMGTSLGLGRGGAELRLRPAVVLWLMAAVLLPWIAAWLVADRAGAWFAIWRAAAGDGDAYLWAVRLLAGLVTYSLASALGLLLAVLVDRGLDAGEESERS
jgi:hypothetical protein